jgi:predicted RNA-binding protein with PUA-like domain
MARWLLKSEPGVYSIQDLERDGRTVWDGVRNNTAALNLKAMKVGDEALCYHSQTDKAVVGVAKIVREAFPDPGDASGRFVAVEIEFVRQLKTPVTLAQMKATPSLKDMWVVKMGRLSVSPVTDAEWTTVLKMAGD